jgi:hypothetical protein
MHELADGRSRLMEVLGDLDDRRVYKNMAQHLPP